MRVRIMRPRAARSFLQETADMNDLGLEPVLRKQGFHSFKAQRIPIILVCQPHHMLGNVVHAEESDRDAPSRYPAKLAHCRFDPFSGQMLEQVIGEAEMKL